MSMRITKGRDMKHWIAWLTLGACLLLFGCQDATRNLAMGRRYRPAKMTHHPDAIDFCREMDLFYNEDFALSYEEDVQLLHAQITGFGLRRTRLDGPALCGALGTAIEPQVGPESRNILLAEAETESQPVAVP